MQKILYALVLCVVSKEASASSSLPSWLLKLRPSTMTELAKFRAHPKHIPFSAHPLFSKTADLPSRFSLDYKRPAFDQGALGSCTANAAAGIYQYFFDKLYPGAPSFKPCRLFDYYEEGVRKKWGQTPVRFPKDQGATISRAVSIFSDVGTCADSNWPYTKYVSSVGESFTKTMPVRALIDHCETEAAYNKFTSYTSIEFNDSADSSEAVKPIKKALFAGSPVIFGFQVFSSFDNKSFVRNKPVYVSMPKAREGISGAHCVWIIGYDDDMVDTTSGRKGSQPKGYFTCVNSWGADWALKGRFYMPYDFVVSPDYCTEFTAINGISVDPSLTKRPVSVPRRLTRFAKELTELPALKGEPEPVTTRLQRSRRAIVELPEIKEKSRAARKPTRSEDAGNAHGKESKERERKRKRKGGE